MSMVKFVAFKAVDVSALTELSVFWSSPSLFPHVRPSTGFTVDATDLRGDISGSGFTYFPKLGGTIKSMVVSTGSPLETAYQVTGLSLSVQSLFKFHSVAKATKGILKGADTMLGSSFGDNLYGYDGNDTIKGNLGTDLLVGGRGFDKLTGGGDSDTFRFNLASESAVGINRDQIIDFQTGVDKIDLGPIDAHAGLPDDQAFTFIGSQSFAAYKQANPGAYGMVRVTAAGIVQVDVGGNKTVDMEIKVLGSLPVETDFHL